MTLIKTQREFLNPSFFILPSAVGVFANVSPVITCDLDDMQIRRFQVTDLQASRK